MANVLTDLEQASKRLNDLDQRRKDQQRYRDDLIKQARDSGVSWTQIKRATGMADRSLALAYKRIDGS
ncbi:hypothetical protein [Agrococcus casei]|uniref:Uncharacterized protein n=1 Tax=Agrococcus casei LMG 22410 TaxID=1255656 RepID=A0A1R4FGW5_9MICO|nr:hypothetical protein [Agrococcus casei]SJM55061.1 hypothetical protein CZ674_04455 [Agrococcus casei LMG 22410]